MNKLVNDISVLASWIGNLISLAVAFATAVIDNWSWIGPIIQGITIAVIGFTVAQGLMTVAEWVGTSAKIAHALATGAQTVAINGQTVATTAAATAQWGLNTALLANPITWVIVLIVAIIAAIIAWVNHIGGLEIAWKVVVNGILIAWDWLKVAFFKGVYWVLNLVDILRLGWQKGCVAIANFIGDMKVTVLQVLQNMINGAIDLINGFIGTLNMIPGVNIELIDHVTFATEAAAENEAAKQAREAELASFEAEINANKANRAADIAAMEAEAAANRAEREAEIAALQGKSASKAATNDPTAHYREKDLEARERANELAERASGNSGGVVVQGEVEIDEDSIQLMKDVSAVEWVNKYTTLRPEMTVTFGDVRETADAAQLLTAMEEMVAEAYASALVEEGL
jgi:hypothetical protein